MLKNLEIIAFDASQLESSRSVDGEDMVGASRERPWEEAIALPLLDVALDDGWLERSFVSELSYHAPTV